MGKTFICICEVLLYGLVLLAGALANGEKVLLLVFGDSLVDCGTKNYLNTSKEHRANYYPYGRNVFSGEATGRFSDGKVTPDFIGIFPFPFLLSSTLQ
ncbi:hypothetical protein AMTR_s00016p00247510 [Amborella trichopoda]|uniref:SGNH hydrolase-type esterase domain-containing protein n=1 Tax=Amborella trichopoda TaxID=13333 RepID=W1PGZ3_AMBTC|nr:hypothetical protein AMTR_s00016p00247510 [Amborella trichopoda]